MLLQAANKKLHTTCPNTHPEKHTKTLPEKTQLVHATSAHLLKKTTAHLWA